MIVASFLLIGYPALATPADTTGASTKAAAGTEFGMIELLCLVGIFLQIGLVLFYFKMRKKKEQLKKGTNIPFAPGSYEYNRHTALHVTAQQLGLSVQPAVTKVYGVVMDWDMSGTVLSLCTYITGAANAFLSSGTAVTGVGSNPAIAEHASALVQMAQDYLSKCMPVSDTGLPLPGTVRFYLLTNNGIYAAQELLSAIDDNSSPWLGLFFRGNMVLDEIKQNPVS